MSGTRLFAMRNGSSYFTMGNVWSWNTQPKEIRVIYVKEASRNLIYPIRWPDSFAQFVRELHELFPKTVTFDQKKFIFQDACDFTVCVMSESTFQALLPTHKQIAPAVNVYYVVLKCWVV